MFSGIKQIPVAREPYLHSKKAGIRLGFRLNCPCFPAQIVRPASEQGAQGLGQERGEDLVALVGRVQAVIGQGAGLGRIGVGVLFRVKGRPA